VDKKICLLFSNDTKVLFSVRQEEVVSGKSVGSQVQLGGITDLEFINSKDHLFIQIRSETFLQVESSPDVNSFTLIFETEVSAEGVESVVSLDLGGDDEGSEDGLFWLSWRNKIEICT